MEIYRKLSNVPVNAIRTIQAGRLKGKSDINPQWRYEAMTEAFGMCGAGWKFEIAKQWIEEGSDNQKFAFVNINLYVKVDGEWSDAIPANGGDMLIKKESNGLYNNDEAFKMAITDALGTAMKYIGVAANIYRSLDKTKYSKEQSNTSKELDVWLNEFTDDFKKAYFYIHFDDGNIEKLRKKRKISKNVALLLENENYFANISESDLQKYKLTDEEFNKLK